MHHENRGQCYFKANDYKKAMSDFEKVLKCEPQNKPVWISLIQSLFNLKRYEDALKRINLRSIINLSFNVE